MSINNNLCLTGTLVRGKHGLHYWLSHQRNRVIVRYQSLSTRTS